MVETELMNVALNAGGITTLIYFMYRQNEKLVERFDRLLSGQTEGNKAVAVAVQRSADEHAALMAAIKRR